MCMTIVDKMEKLVQTASDPDVASGLRYNIEQMQAALNRASPEIREALQGRLAAMSASLPQEEEAK